MAETTTKTTEEVRGPGETLWLAHSKIFGSTAGDWHALDLQDKLRWSLVEEMTVEHLMAQGDFPPGLSLNLSTAVEG